MSKSNTLDAPKGPSRLLTIVGPLLTTAALACTPDGGGTIASEETIDHRKSMNESRIDALQVEVVRLQNYMTQAPNAATAAELAKTQHELVVCEYRLSYGAMRGFVEPEGENWTQDCQAAFDNYDQRMDQAAVDSEGCGKYEYKDLVWRALNARGPKKLASTSQFCEKGQFTLPETAQEAVDLTAKLQESFNDVLEAIRTYKANNNLMEKKRWEEDGFLHKLEKDILQRQVVIASIQLELFTALEHGNYGDDPSDKVTKALKGAQSELKGYKGIMADAEANIETFGHGIQLPAVEIPME